MATKQIVSTFELINTIAPLRSHQDLDVDELILASRRRFLQRLLSYCQSSGGQITLGCDQLNASSSTLRVVSGSNGNAVDTRGGNILVTANTVVEPTVKNTLTAQGLGAASAGGNITFNISGSTTLYLGNSARSYSFSATGGSAGGDGGSLVVNAPGTIVTFEQGTVDVSARSDGAGGLVEFLPEVVF